MELTSAPEVLLKFMAANAAAKRQKLTRSLLVNFLPWFFWNSL
jgi:hypothetical protein